MRIQSRFFIGLLYLVIVRIKNTSVQSACKVINLSANCARKDYKDIPQDLDMNLESLDASFNPIQELREDDFKRYPKLVNLRLHGIPAPGDRGIIYPSNVFAHLKNLQKLDLSESAFFIFNTEIIWPEKLQHLNVGGLTDTRFTSLNLTKLSELGYLNASYNQIDNFPALHPEAPVYWIDLKNNPLSNVTAEHIAPYCLLRYLRIIVIRPGNLNTPVLTCECRRLEKWMLKYNIAGMESTCHAPLSGQVDNCKTTEFSEEMYKQRNACLSRQPTSSMWKFMALAVVVSSVFPAGYLGLMFYKNYKKRKESPGTNDSSGDGDDADAGDASEPSPES